MNQLILQIVAAVFTLFALSRVYFRFQERKLSSFSFIFWAFIWLVGVSVILFPAISTKAASLLGIGRGADAVLYASIAVIFYLIFRIYVKIEDTQKQITEIIQKVALENYYKEKKTSLNKNSTSRKK